MKFPTGYVVDTMNATDLIEMRPTHKLVPDGKGLPIALCRSGSDAARIAKGLRLLETSEQPPMFTIDPATANFSTLSLHPGSILKFKTTVTLPESEILARAREAAIACGRFPSDERACRAGEFDDGASLAIAARALHDLAKPLSEVVPADPDQEREKAAVAEIVARSGENGTGKEFGPYVGANIIAAAIRRGRELEREAR